MNQFSNPSRTRAIRNAFKDAYAGALGGLSVHFGEITQQTFSKKPGLSGSGGPRAVLAYYFAVWSISFGKFGEFRVPIVIDSPNQQGQDALNMHNVIEFVSAKMSFDTQMILLSEVDAPWDFDKKIELDSPYSLLRNEEYAGLSQKLEPLVDKMYTSLRINKNLFGEWDLSQ
jgi:hypothetical protein